jgi:hypothetical protein
MRKFYSISKVTSLIALIMFLAAGQISAQGFQSITNLNSLTVSAITGEKPQSKVWTYAGRWWMVMPNSSGTQIWRLDGTTWTSVLNISASTATFADCKAVGNVTHILLYQGTSSSLVSVEYVPATHTYQVWTIRNTTVSITLDASVETASIDIDGTGRMWLANAGTTEVYVRWADSPYSTWSSPITIATGIDDDDICAVTAFNGRIGVLWSNQVTDRFGFKYHVDADPVSTWSADEVPASQSALSIGSGMADDHLNFAVASDGTIYAAVKTSYDTPGNPRIALLIRRPAGTWDNIYSVDEGGTRGIVVLNEAAGKVSVIFTASDAGGNILYRESPTSSIAFGSTNILMSGGTWNNATSTKQNYSNEIVILAGNGSSAAGVLGSNGSFALNFDGTNDASTTDYINCGTSASADITGAITLEAWVRSDGAATQSIVKKNTATTGYELSLSNNTGAGLPQNYFFRLNGNDTYRVNSTSYYPVDGTWAHVAGTYDGSVMKLYVNGVQEGGNVPGPASFASNTSNLVIGTDAGAIATKSFNGGIDEVRVWNVARTAQEILDNYKKEISSGTGLVGRWGMNEGTGTATANSIAGGLNGTLMNGTVVGNGPLWVPGAPFGGVVAPTVPIAPTLVSPANAATGIAISPTLSWNTSTGASSYRVQVSTVSNFATTVYDQSGIASTSTLVTPALANNTPYYWRVNATNTQGTSEWSAERSFTTIALGTAPPAPTLISPVNAALSVAIPTTLSWNASAGAASYQVQVSTTSGFSTTVFDQSGIAATSAAVTPALFNNTVYYWRVNATNVSGTSVWSPVWTFTTVALTPPIEDNGAGYALDFDGTNDYVNCGNNGSVQITGTAITMEAWIKPTKTATMAILKKCDPIDNTPPLDGKGYELYPGTAGFIYCRINGNDASRAVSTTSYSNFTWMHVAATYDGANTRMYINGVLEATTPYTAPIVNSSANSLYIANDPSTAARFFQGAIDEVRLWNVVRSDEDIKANMTKKLVGNETGLVGYWRFDETSGTLMNDETANNNDGTITNMDQATDHVWSGAAIGDASANDYDAVGGYTATLTHTNGDAITATTTLGTITGIQVYRADDNAVRTGSTGLAGYSLDPLRFWGVRAIGTAGPIYTVVYNYTGNPAVISEAGLKLVKRNDISIAAWTDAFATLDMTANTLTVTGQTGTEYALAIPTATTWTGGGTSYDWNVPANWSNGAVPWSAIDVTIPDLANDPIISSTTQVNCKNLYVASGASLTIQSNAAGSGSLIATGTSTGTVTYERLMTTGTAWHYVSSPVSLTVTPTGSFYAWNEVAGDWNASTTATPASGLGYTLVSNEPAGTVSFTGSLVTSDININATSPYLGTITGTEDNYNGRSWSDNGTGHSGTTLRSLTNYGGGGWNLLGNPYTSAMSVSAFIDANYSVTPANSKFDPNYVALYLFNGSTYNYVAKSTGWPDGTYLSATHIQVGQGFFVLAMNDLSAFTFTRSMQGHNTGVSLLKSAKAEDRWPGLQLKVKYGEKENSTLIVYNENMTAGLDPGYDVGLMSSGSGFEIYTTLVKDNEVNFARQALPVSGADTTVVPIGIDSEKGGEITFSAVTEQLGSYRFWLEDRAKGIFTNLNANTYTVTLPENTYGTGRFFIIASTNTPTGLQPPQAEDMGVRIWVSNDKVIIKGEVSEKAICEIYNVNGKKILDTRLTGGELNTISIPSTTKGVYIVRMTDGVKVTTKKVAIL